MRVAVCLAWVLLMAGCVAAQVREEAASTLRCPAGDVRLEEKHEGQWLATGCGRAAICIVPREQGAHVQCGGGGEALPPRS